MLVLNVKIRCKCRENIYYIDASVLLENNQRYIFHILTSEYIDEFIYHFLHWIYIIKRKLHGGLAWGYELYFLVMKTIFYSFASLICKILFSPLEDKIHIFAPPCNILSNWSRLSLKMYIFPTIEFTTPYFNIYLLTKSVNAKYYLQ